MQKKVRFNYSTTDERIKKLKMVALQEDLTVNVILDYLIDLYFQSPEDFDFENNVNE